MGRVRSSRTTPKHGQNGTKALRARLRYSEDVQVALARGPEVWGAMNIKINIKSTTCTRDVMSAWIVGLSGY